MTEVALVATPPTDAPDPVDYGARVPDQRVDQPEPPGGSGRFTVRLANFTGPFDLLLQLIGKHKLDVTEIALHQVTDEFIAYIRAMGDDWDLGETSEFLLVAATLLDLKAARLLPAAEVEDEEDLALLEARDLLFARLLQYKAFKEAAAVIAELEGVGVRRWPRVVSLEPRYAEALPDLVLGIGAERLLKLAVKALSPKPGPPQVSITHVHQVRVSVREHANLLRDRLRRAGVATFALLTADCENTLEIVARFLALLELYREGLVDFEQPESLGELTVRWTGGDAVVDLDIDEYAGSPPSADEAAAPLPSSAVSLPSSADDVPSGDLVSDDLVPDGLTTVGPVPGDLASVDPSGNLVSDLVPEDLAAEAPADGSADVVSAADLVVGPANERPAADGPAAEVSAFGGPVGEVDAYAVELTAGRRDPAGLDGDLDQADVAEEQVP